MPAATGGPNQSSTPGVWLGNKPLRMGSEETVEYLVNTYRMPVPIACRVSSTAESRNRNEGSAFLDFAYGGDVDFVRLHCLADAYWPMNNGRFPMHILCRQSLWKLINPTALAARCPECVYRSSISFLLFA